MHHIRAKIPRDAAKSFTIAERNLSIQARTMRANLHS
jgi:hypothetical protein